MRNNVQSCPSPNFKKPSGQRVISCVVIHATATSGLESPKAWLTNPDSKVSAHYLIGKDGSIFQLVEEKNIAWHAGESSWNGQDGVNSFSVGIELVNSNDGRDPYPPDQFEACAQLVASICKDYAIKPHDVVGHLDIAPGRKTDPAEFDFSGFRVRIADLGAI